MLIFTGLGVALGMLQHDLEVAGVALLTLCLWLHLVGLQALLKRLHVRATAAREKNEELARLL